MCHTTKYHYSCGHFSHSVPDACGARTCPDFRDYSSSTSSYTSSSSTNTSNTRSGGTSSSSSAASPDSGGSSGGDLARTYFWIARKEMLGFPCEECDVDGLGSPFLTWRLEGGGKGV